MGGGQEFGGAGCSAGAVGALTDGFQDVQQEPRVILKPPDRLPSHSEFVFGFQVCVLK